MVLATTPAGFTVVWPHFDVFNALVAVLRELINDSMAGATITARNRVAHLGREVSESPIRTVARTVRHRNALAPSPLRTVGAVFRIHKSHAHYP